MLCSMLRRRGAGSLGAALVLFLSLAGAGPAFCSEDLASQVTIRRDTFGVAHILADTEEAAMFGSGYVSAEDHILEIARLYIQARGEEAAYFGERYVKSDYLTKLFRNLEIAEEGFAKTAPWFRFLLDAYAGGYNRYIEKNRDDLPKWIEPITGVDVLALGRYDIVMGFYMNLGQIAQIGRTRTAKAEIPGADFEELPGSNMWAIGKERSATGNALLLGNPHLAWSGGQTFYELHVTVPGKINYMGATLIGLPSPALGFNEYLGWSHTVNPNDSNDIYELTLDPANPGHYLYDGHSVPLRKETIEIKVKTDKFMVSQTRDVLWSHYGPIVKEEAGKAYAFKSASADEYRLLEEWYLLSKCKSLDEFRRVLDMQALPMFNIAYADVEGNCFYICNGRFPDRPKGYDWSGVVPGNTSATEWNSILPQERIPQLLNPPGGYVQNSNSSPWYTNLNAIIDRREHSEDVFSNFNTLRTQLGLEMLEGDDSITLEELKGYKYNMKLLLADRVKDSLIKAVRGGKGGDAGLDAAAKVLEAWDNTASRESRGSVLFVEFWKLYARKANPAFRVAWTENKPASTPYGIGDTGMARVALAEAAVKVREKYGAIDVAWGDVYRLQRGDLDIPIGGLTTEYGAFRVINYRPSKGKMVAAGGDSYVFAVEFSKPLKAFSILAYSQSENPESPHHTDQSTLFANKEWKEAWFYEEDIAKHTERSYHP